MRKFTGDRLLLATHNAGKLDEMQALLGPMGITVVGAGELGLDEPEETETTFLGNARIKAHAAARATGLPALADDSGIEVDGLGGAPGVHTADWAATPDGRDFDQAMNRTWAALEEAQAPYPRTARFRATLVLAWPDGHDEVFEGRAEGEVVWPTRGAHGHGYDPMFQPAGQSRTFAEMGPEEKNAISHRADAVAKLMACLAPVQRISTGSPFEEKWAFSRAVVKGGWCFVAGVTGYDYATMTMPAAALDQARNCFATIDKVLKEGGFSMSDVVRVQYTITEAALADEIAPALREALAEVRPASTMVVAGLVTPEMKVEVEVTAFRG